ncbi:hypothetical protein BLOT_013183 [Blomia tropicalis]|nr:hypothetical protein BLOT_013183 [Blomia tropicalis]
MAITPGKTFNINSSISPKCFATFTTSHRECLYPSTSTITFNSFILVLNNIIHSSISTATPISIFILVLDHRQHYIHQYQQNI